MSGSLRQVAGWPSALHTRVVMPGLDPGIHHLSKDSSRRGGLPGQPGNDECWLDRKTSNGSHHVGAASDCLVLFPRVTQLGLHRTAAGFLKPARAKVHLIWKRIEPVAQRLRC